MCMYVFVYVNKQVSVYLYLCVIHLCVYVCMYECLCICKSVVYQISLESVPKSAKCKNGICVSVCACVCGVPNIKLVKCKMVFVCMCM